MTKKKKSKSKQLKKNRRKVPGKVRSKKRARLSAKQVAELFQTAFTFHELGNLKQAQEIYTRIVRSDNMNETAIHYLGVIARETGRLDDAVGLILKAIKLNPSYEDACNSLGITYQKMGDMDGAVSAYKKALAINPNFVQVLNNLGDARKKQGKLERAMYYFRKALFLQPDFAQAHNNLGTVFHAQGEIKEAIDCYERAIIYDEKMAEAYTNMAQALAKQGDRELALKRCLQAISINQEYDEAYYTFVRIVNGISFEQQHPHDSAIYRCLQHCLLRDDIDHQLLLWPTLSLIFNDETGRCVSGFVDNNGNFSPSTLLLEKALIELLSNQLFLLLLKKTIFTDLSLERFLTKIRGCLLDDHLSSGGDMETDSFIPDLLYALANQCFRNEYVYPQNETESKNVERLVNIIKDKIEQGDETVHISVVLLACYIPIRSVDSIVDWIVKSYETFPVEFIDLATIMVAEPSYERELAKEIPQLNDITNHTSQEVMSMYEENPYPRWISLTGSQEVDMLSILLEDIAPNNIFQNRLDLSDSEILIAGCGTGRHPLSRSFIKGSNLLAIDLSLASLSYAKRKALEMKVSNVGFLQADILSLAQLNRTFDIIECSGVLHHMENPEAGWRILTDLLRPGGFMKVGLYSRHARKHVAAVRSFLGDVSGESPEIDVRALREVVLERVEPALLEKTLLTDDFYSMSGVRDLLFHVQEHQFALPEIGEMLENLELTFLGFTFETGEVKARYRECFSDDQGARSLSNWNKFELENPDTFANMYQFWVQKSG